MLLAACRRFGRLFLAVLFATAALPGAASAAAHPPDISWKTLETSHFLIHFPARSAAVARRLAGMVEPIHDRLTRAIGWTPEERTHIVLIDYLDLTNGSATPSPHNAIQIYTTPPAPASALGDQDDWLRLVFTHEYNHILHLDQAFGPAKAARDMLGRAAIAGINGIPVPVLPFPNLFLPLWMVEGYATLDETEHTTAGRGDSSYTAMILRTAALQGTLFPLDKGNGDEGEWPGGAFRYLYGEAFLDYLSAKYGRERLNAMYHAYATGLSPLLPSAAAVMELGASLESEWEAWQRNLIRESRALRRSLRAHAPFTRAEALTQERWSTRRPRFSPDGATVYFTVQNATAYPHVRAVDLGTGVERVLFEHDLALGNLAPSADGRYLYFVQGAVYERFNVYGDAFRYDFASGTVERLTTGARLLSLDVSPDGRWLAAVQNDVSEQRLMLYPMEAGRPGAPRTLAGGADRIFDTPRFSPDGSRLAYAAWSRGGFIDLYVTDLQGGERRLTADRHLDLAPVFLDDDTLLFSSDRTGIYNLYTVPAGSPAPATAVAQEMVQMTHTPFGFFESDVHAGRVVAAAYDGRGFYPARIALSPVTSPAVAWRIDRAAWQDRSAPWSGPERDYRAAETLWPRQWMPYLTAESLLGSGGWAEAGVSLTGEDVLGMHAYELTGFYHTLLDRPGFAFGYQWDGWTPTLGLAALDAPRLDTLHAGAEPDAETGVRAQGAAASVLFPFPGLRSAAGLTAEYSLVHEREIGMIAGDGIRLSRRSAGAALQFTFGSARHYTNSISIEDGARFSLTGRAIAPWLGATYTNHSAVADLRYYWSLPARQVLAVQGVGGIASNARFGGPFRLGGLEEQSSLGTAEGIPLRGFATTSLQQGSRVAKASLEYRFPLLFLKRGIPAWGTFPLLVDQLHGALYAEGGSAWIDSPVWRAAVGGEFIVDLTIGYLFPLSLGIGAALPVSPAAERNGLAPYFVLHGYAF